ncbi:MAG: WYL domain-containing protein [Salibacter sp.]|uniref:helix-turn-helix transcriptional regulator n=2 Tax=Salibacter sp. TaxID=2010995 RepID=UPI00287018C3|nr:WYL domain-containing protein [Salibacter sp.]MDR9399167.1 WYL domain-containing protein [Salibacter sp.]
MSHSIDDFKSYVIIHQQVESGSRSVKELSKTLENRGLSSSERTVKRRIRELRDQFGLDIQFSQKYKGYILEEDSTKSDSFGKMVKLFANAELFQKAKTNPKMLFKYIQFDYSEGYKGNEYLSECLRAIEDKKVIAVKYRPFVRNEVSIYTMHPYLLKEFMGRWYVIGYVKERKSLRSLALDRVLNIDLKRESFEEDKSQDLKEHFQKFVGLVYEEHETEIIKIRVNKFQSKYLKTLPIHHTQTLDKEDEHYSYYSYYLSSNIEFKQKLLMMGARVKVLSPDWLIDEMKEEVQKMMSNYN